MAEQAGKDAAGEAAGGWFKDFFRSKLRLLLAAGLGLAALNASAGVAFDWYYRCQVLRTLERGVLPPPLPQPELERAELRQRVMALLAPPEPSRFYHIVTGPPGSGKSRLLRQACRDLGRGVGYVDVGPAFEVDWGRDLGNAFNFRRAVFREHMSRVNMVFKPVLGTQWEEPSGEHPLASLRQSAEALHDAAREYRARTGRPFLLVIDSADRLAQAGEKDGGGNGGGGGAPPPLLRAMLSYARDWAGEGAVTTVFVAHEWATVELLAGDHPAQSRAGPPLVVPDISAKEARQYLAALGVPPQEAQQCVDLVGGSLLLLQRCAGMLRSGLPFPELRRQLHDFVELAFLRAGLLDATPQQRGGLAALEALLAGGPRGAITAAEWRGCVPDRRQQLELLGKGVLRSDGRHITWASSLAASFAAEQLWARLPRAVAEQHPRLRPRGGE